MGPGISWEWGPEEDRQSLIQGPGGAGPGREPASAQNSTDRGRQAAGTRHPGRSASEQSRSPGPETQQHVHNKAGLAWRCLCPSSTRQDTWMDTQPGSGWGSAPTHPTPEKQTQHRDPVLRPQRAGSAQRLGPHPLTSRQNPALHPQHRSVTQQLPKTLKSPRGPPGPVARRQCPAESRGGALGASGACHMTVLKKNKLSGSSWCTDVNLLLETRMNSQLSEWRGHTLVLLLCHPGLLGQPSGGTTPRGPPCNWRTARGQRSPAAPPRGQSTRPPSPESPRPPLPHGLLSAVTQADGSQAAPWERELTIHTEAWPLRVPCRAWGPGPGSGMIRHTDRPAVPASSSLPTRAGSGHAGHTTHHPRGPCGLPSRPGCRLPAPLPPATAPAVTLPELTS